MALSRRQFLRLSAAGIGGTSLVALGFAPGRVLDLLLAVAGEP